MLRFRFNPPHLLRWRNSRGVIRGQKGLKSRASDSAETEMSLNRTNSFFPAVVKRASHFFSFSVVVPLLRKGMGAQGRPAALVFATLVWLFCWVL